MKLILLGFMHGFGGAEKSLCTLANEMVERGHEVHLLSFSRNNLKYNLNFNVQYDYIKDVGDNKIEILCSRFKQLRNKLKKIKPDIVISFWFQLCVFSVLSRFGMDYKIVYSERGDPYDSEYSGINAVLRKLTFSFVDGFVFQTKSAENCFNKRIKNKSIVIHNAISINDKIVLTKSKKNKQIIAVGRLHSQKNFSLCVRAFKIVHEKCPDYSLIIYGDGELFFDLNNEIKKGGLEKCVEIKNSTPDIYLKMKESEIFVLSSDYEGMPNVLLEAMALGLPCVSTDYSPKGSVNEIITNNKNGIIVPRNDYEKFANAIIRLINDKNLSSRIGIEASKIINTHSHRAIYDKWNYFFERLINR